MAGLADHLGKLLFTRAGARATRPPSPKVMWGRARTRLGSWRAVAQTFGVSESTLRRWRRGQAVPSAPKVAAMREWDTASRMRKGSVPDSQLLMRWEFDGRARTVNAAQLRLTPGALDAVRQAWVTGGPAAAVEAFVSRVGDGWYRQHLAAWDARERALAALPEAPDDLTDDELADLEDSVMDDIGDVIGGDIDAAYGDEVTYDDVAGEEIQSEIADYDMSVHSL